MMKALVLAGGDDQRTLIRELKKRGYIVLLADYYPNPPAKTEAAHHYRVSTLDQDAILEIARNENVALVTTACTDQALLTVAAVSEKLGLPTNLSHAKALSVTNKAEMKARFSRYSIPSAKFSVVDRSAPFDDPKISLPVVVKPVDGNGSKGVRKVWSADELSVAIAHAASESRSGQVIVEEFQPGMEISVDVFVSGGRARVLMMTRTLKNRDNASRFPIVASRYPAPLSENMTARIAQAAQDIASAFALDNTFLIVQLIAGEDDLNVVEFSARLGGGSKHHLIQRITGIDPIVTYVDSLFGPVAPLAPRANRQHVALNYVYGRPGTVAALPGWEMLRDHGVIDDFFVYKTMGTAVQGSDASRDRIASFLVEASSATELESKIARADAALRALDETGSDMIIHGLWSDTLHAF